METNFEQSLGIHFRSNFETNFRASLVTIRGIIFALDREEKKAAYNDNNILLKQAGKKSRNVSFQTFFP
jgi:hypothetical protein